MRHGPKHAIGATAVAALVMTGCASSAGTQQAFGDGTWLDKDGRRVSETTVNSFQGPQHCDWQDITFLHVGAGADGQQFLRDTTGEFGESLRTTFDATAQLPPGATDTGFRKDGRALWIGPQQEAAYLVSTADPADVERWPASEQLVACA